MYPLFEGGQLLHPYIKIFGFPVSSYMTTAIIGFFAILFVASLTSRKRNDIDRVHIPYISLTAMAGLIIGAHILFGIVNIKVLFHAIGDGFSKIHSFTELIMFFVYLFGGMVFYGGLFGAIFGVYFYLKYVGLPAEGYYDAMAFSVPLFHGFARIGCFLSGCCYGIECQTGFVFHNAIEPSANGVSRFPVQLLESGLDFILFAVILILYVKRRLSGRLIYVYLLSYSVIRFFDEFLRGDKARGFVGFLSTSQFISVLLFLTVIAILVFKAVKGKKPTATEEIASSK